MSSWNTSHHGLRNLKTGASSSRQPPSAQRKHAGLPTRHTWRPPQPSSRGRPPHTTSRTTSRDPIVRMDGLGSVGEVQVSTRTTSPLAPDRPTRAPTTPLPTLQQCADAAVAVDAAEVVHSVEVAATRTKPTEGIGPRRQQDPPPHHRRRSHDYPMLICRSLKAQW